MELISLNISTGDCTELDLGMQYGSIPDNRITASSELNVSTPAKNGRLNYTAGSSWCGSTNDSNPYLQIDLQTLHIICAVSTQGNSQADDWVKTYTLQSSRDGKTWANYAENGSVKVSFRIHKQLHPSDIPCTERANSMYTYNIFNGIVALYIGDE